MQDLEKIKLFDGSFYDYHYYDDPEPSICGYRGYTEASVNTALIDLAIALFQPKSCIDLGCAKGLYVKDFRNKNINAWGVDFSQYAIENIPPEMSRYLFCMDVLKFAQEHPYRVGMPSKKGNFSLVFMQDLFEHMPLNNCDQLIAELPNLGQNLFTCFAALPLDDDPRREQYEEEWKNAPEHINMLPWNIWEEKFQAMGIPYFVIYTIRFGHWDIDNVIWRSSFPIPQTLIDKEWQAFLDTLPG